MIVVTYGLDKYRKKANVKLFFIWIYKYRKNKTIHKYI